MNQITDLGPFELVISKRAEKLDFDDLTAGEKADMPQAVSARAKSNEIYRFCLMVKFTTDHLDKRTRLRKSYDRVDLLIAHVRLPVADIHLLGIAPVTRPGQPADGADGSLQAEVAVAPVRLTVGGQIKDLVRRKAHAVISARTDREAQWLFLKSFIAGNTSFCLTLYLDVPDDLPEQQRYVLCSAEARDHGRTVARIVNRRMLLPAEAGQGSATTRPSKA